MLRALLVLLGLAAIVVALLLATGMMSIDQTRPGVVQAPKFEADMGRIDIGTANRTVEVPTIAVERAANAN